MITPGVTQHYYAFMFSFFFAGRDISDATTIRHGVDIPWIECHQMKNFPRPFS